MNLLYTLRNFPNLLRGAPDVISRSRPMGTLSAVVIRADGLTERLGLISTRVVTDAGVAFIVDAFQGSTELENFKYHAMGTGTGEEAAGDTALGTEVESREEGTQIEGATANIYKSVATITATDTRAITEHGIFSASSSGTLLDRSKFAAINLASGDSIQFTYQLTFPSGS